MFSRSFIPSLVEPPSPHIADADVVIRLKVGPLWKLAYTVEPYPEPTADLNLSDEKTGPLIHDGPFSETKA